MSHSDQLYHMNTALLEVAVAHHIDSDNLVIRQNKETKEWRIVDITTRKIWFKKIF